MYIDAFWAGVLITVCAELLILFALSIAKKGKKDGQ